MTEPASTVTPGVRVGRWVILAATTGTVLIGIGAFWLSFTALADLAHRSGIAAELSWIWPLIVDGVIVVATISVVALSRYGRGATRYAWLLLAGGAAVSVSANVTHATVAAAAEVPDVLAAMVASIPPIVLLAITHLTVVLTRYRHSDTAAAEPPAPQRPAAVAFTVVRDQPERSPRAALEASDADRKARTTAPSSSSAGRERAEARRAQGWSNRRIAAELGVHPATVGRWLPRSSDVEHPDDSNESSEEQR